MKRACFVILALLSGACGPTTPSADDDDDGAGGDGGPGFADGGGGVCGAQCQNFCPNGTQTTISGTVTAPNGIDPVPGAVVYVPLHIDEFPETVACEVCDQITSGALVRAITAADGSFTLGPLPTTMNPIPGSTIDMIAQKGRFRRVSHVVIQNWCLPNTGDDADFRLPGKNDGQNTIPKIAVATGDYDIMECVLLRFGLEQGQFDLYGASFDDPPGLPQFNTLLMNGALMKTYNILFINCTDNTYEGLLTNATIRNNLLDYVAAGGRLYVTDWSYDYIEQITEFAPMIDFGPGTSAATPEPVNAAAIGDDGITTNATVHDTGMIAWLHAVEARSGQEAINDDDTVHVEHFLSGWVMQFAVPVTEISKVWLSGVVSGGGLSGEFPLTTTFDYAQCGRVLYSSYHTRGRDPFGFPGDTFPAYCPAANEPLSAQERVLEFLILHVADCIQVD